MTGCSWARTQPQPPRAKRTPTLSLDVTEPLGTARHQWPVSTGVPFPPGAVREAAQVALSDATGPLAVQTRPLSRWPDGSIRWALLDWQTDLHARETRHYRVGAGAAPPPARGVRVTDRGTDWAVDTGVLQFVIPRSRFAVLDHVHLNGVAIAGPVSAFFTVGGKRLNAEAPGTVTLLENGPLRTRIELRGHYSAAFDYVIRIDAYAQQPFVRILHSFEQRSSEPYTFVQQIALDVSLPLQGPATYTAGQEHGAPLAGTVGAAPVTLFQEDNATVQVNGAPRSGRAAGWVDLHDSQRGMAIAARYFWQEYPQSFELRPTGLTYNEWAPQAAPAKVGMGAAKTHELVLYFHGPTAPTAATLDALREPLTARLDPQWIVHSGALRNSIAPTPDSAGFLRDLAAAHRRYQDSVDSERWDDSGEVHCPDAAHERPRRGFYGMFNWGDWNYAGYHDSTKGCDAWGNLEYDLTQVLALAYAATGTAAYHDGMVAAARHFMDVDRIYYQRDHPKWVGMNHPKNPLHFSFELGGVDLGHTWTEGLLSYYYLTGDERGLQAATGIADYLVQRLRAGRIHGNPRQYGWPVIALLATYEATANDPYKQAALQYAHSGMAAHPPERLSDWKLGILADALAYAHALTQDAGAREWLQHYAAAVRAHPGALDPRLMPAFAYVAQLTANPEDTRRALAALQRPLGNWGKPFTIGGRLGFRLLSVAAARP